jgi:hypothetical protein
MIMPALLVKIYEILKRHIGMEVFYIYKYNNKIYLDEGILLDVDEEHIRIREKSGLIKDNVYFEEGYPRTLLNVYNSKYIDLLKAKITDSMARKVMKSELQKTIVKNLKFNMGSELAYICLTYDGFEIHYGKFKNMRISDIVIVKDCQNSEDFSLPYTSVLHIYNSDGEDLINV